MFGGNVSCRRVWKSQTAGVWVLTIEITGSILDKNMKRL